MTSEKHLQARDKAVNAIKVAASKSLELFQIERGNSNHPIHSDRAREIGKIVGELVNLGNKLERMYG